MTKNFGEFVKLTEVHQIVEDVYLPLLEAVQVREEELSQMRAAVNLLSNEMKQQKADVRQALLMKNKVNDIDKLCKGINEKYQIADSMIRH